MNNFKKMFYLSALILTSSIYLSGCGSSDDDEPSGCNSLNWSTELSTEITALTTAFTTFGQNPTQANCNNYRQSIVNYINALRPYGNCQALSGQSKDEWQKLIDDYEDNLGAMDCSEI
ncbi:hypothetical protein [Cyclobacterium qasimii]|uniref:Lipoprotein n=1 Tax=Cyclobacterium qasimii TaxID=1350429 RepID=A0A512C5X6_9BACT|nr:hypothetical protein [Cyclobacterium qasimii]GEO19612.1 hypothetical protein CQA01_01460 [Cyclobacterium qasimii]